MAQDETVVEIEGRTVRLSNLGKVLYPEAGFTKGQIIDYYARIAPVLLPHLEGRPLTLKRYPNGVTGMYFYEKNCPRHRPEWVQTAPVWSEGNNTWMKYCLVQDLATLVWCANLADIELHTSLSRAADILRPTMIVFDLDPGEPADIVQCCQVALWVRAIFDRLGLESFPKTSGSKGLQVYVPLNSAVTYDETKPLAHELARTLERQHPDLVVSEMKKNLRGGKVFVDWSQNDDHKTTVCVYSLRAKARPTVSAPVKWDEVERCLQKRDPELLVFDSGQVLSRSEKLGDLFAPILKLRQKLPALDELRKLSAAGDAAGLIPRSRAASKKSATAGERRGAVPEQLTQAKRDAPIAGKLRLASKGVKSAKPRGRSTTSKRRPA
ncbi:MAG: non-homologous end-joining DNA ligase [Candidatus Korobacteraceae bacterium]